MFIVLICNVSTFLPLPTTNTDNEISQAFGLSAFIDRNKSVKSEQAQALSITLIY